jgi:hypothetical protein
MHYAATAQGSSNAHDTNFGFYVYVFMFAPRARILFYAYVFMFARAQV